MLGTGDARYILNPEILVRPHVIPALSHFPSKYTISSNKPWLNNAYGSNGLDS
jgi:hypothetical protein